MLKTLSFAFRNLRVRPGRSLLTLFSIGLGVAVILAIRIANVATLEAVTSVFNESSGKAQLVVLPTSSSDYLPSGLLSRVRNMAGVREAIPILQARAVLANESAPAGMDLGILGMAEGGFLVYGIDPVLDIQAREYVLAEGRFLDPTLDAYDIVLVKDFADREEIEVGDTIAIRTTNDVELLTVVGLISQDGAGKLNNGEFGVIPLEAAQEIFSRALELDQIDILAIEDSTSTTALEILQETLQERIGDDYSVTFPAARGQRVAQMLDGYQIGLSMFSAIALFVGIFLIFNTFSMTVVERMREIGMLRTLGMTRRQVMRQIFSEAVLLGLAGAIVGIGLGILLSKGLIRVMELVVGQEVSDIGVPVPDLLLSIGVGIAATLVATAIPAIQASRISPLTALRVRAGRSGHWLAERGWIVGVILLAISFLVLYVIPLPPYYGAMVRSTMVFVLLLGGALVVPATVGTLERMIRPLVKPLFGNEGKLGSSNVLRAKLRTALTVAALMIGVAMILSIRSISSAFQVDLGDWMQSYIGGELYVISNVRMRAELGRRLASVEGVQTVAPIRYLDITLNLPSGEEESVSMMAVEPLAYQEVASFVFSSDQGDPNVLAETLAEGDTVFVSSVLAEQLHLQQGDTVWVQTRRGRRPFSVSAIVVDFYNQGMVIHASWKDLRRYFGNNDVSAFLIKIDDGADAQQVRDRIDALYGEARHLTVQSNTSLRDRALGLISQTSVMFDALAAIAMAVAALGVVNTMTMNVYERTQEIGMLRSIGMAKRQVRKMILAEAFLVGFIGATFGLIFGIFMSRIMLQSMNAMSGYDLAYIMPIQGVIFSLIVTLLVSQLAAILPARHAATLRIIEAIQME